MSIRVVLYAEGSAEQGGDVRVLPQPGHDLDEVHLGPGHLLIRRVVAESANCPTEAVRFVSPLRWRARIVRGSALLDPKILKSLVAFPDNLRRPNLAVVLIDEDGDGSRRGLAAALEGSVVPTVVGVAAPEFEAWLLADHANLARLLRVPINPPSETMSPRAAKAFLADSIGRAGSDIGGGDAVRRAIADSCDLRVLQRVRDFELLMKDVGRCLGRRP